MKGNILVVDDIRDNLRLLSNILTEQGYKVRPVSNGIRAISAAQSIPPDLILLDIMMPEMDGYAVCEQLKADARTREIPIIFISALNETFDKIKAFSAGGVDYITKPFQPEEVLARVETQLKLLQRTRELHDLNASKDKFFSIIAHDLRSPLLAISRYSEQLQSVITQQAIGGIVQESADKLRHSVASLQTLLENLLTWARIQRGMIKYEPAQVELGELIEENLILFEAVAEQKEITLHCDDVDNIQVYADSIMVKTILRNLLSNALKFTQPGGTITVSMISREQQVEVSVTDTGCGIEPEGLEKLFRLDSQYTNVGTAGEKGAGLGLLLCKDMIEKHGSAIAVDSEVGKGTTFTFSLPSQATSE